MDAVEKMRRWKRSLDGFISFRKAVLLACVAFVFLLYLGPTIFGWIFGRGYSKLGKDLDIRETFHFRS